MQLDLNLIRRIAFAVEALAADKSLSELDGVLGDVFFEHARWMDDAGLIKSIFTGVIGESGRAHIHRLTWNGCEFLDAVRDEALWKFALEFFEHWKVVPAFDSLMELLRIEIRRRLFLDGETLPTQNVADPNTSALITKLRATRKDQTAAVEQLSAGINAVLARLDAKGDW